MAALGRSELSTRDRALVELVGKFRQMTSKQIGISLFSSLASQTPLDRALKRLVERRYLERLDRLVGGNQGGSAQYVYQLGRAGWKHLRRPGVFWAPRAVNLHTLAIADCYAELKRREQTGQLELIQFVAEPECHRVVGDVLLTPDAYIEVGNRPKRIKRTYWLEVDRGTEQLNKIQEKCQRYWTAYRAWREEYFPRVFFVVPDEQRKEVIVRVVSKGPLEARYLFVTRLLGDACQIRFTD
ncbi:replication-relaxation family protein [Allokutzneria sp. A3M-2-11 16]|uniref:replication-relaxation family protein n=1 Tax=Allokutzneria sp. A3M-2-11 16 TaxID=2962043 RepID=UPI0020B718FC|nr:replication-relaxation family protein [Allokutzneria sp. A3M-2-11 16]MCP3797984.1 replication-relaxation family protein [Allokutzneria sp. A3M-2-11 16]